MITTNNIPSYVKFKESKYPCIVYNVLGDNIVIEFDEVEETWLPCLEISVLGFVWIERLEPCSLTGNIESVDVLTKIDY